MNSSYPCRLKNSDTSSNVTFSIDTPQVPAVFIAAYPGTYIILGQPDTLVAIVTGAIFPTYQWYRNNTIITGATTNTYIHTYTATANDSLTCQVTSHGICRVSSFGWVFVSAVTGVADLSGNADIHVLPNPSNGDFTVTGTLNTAIDREVSIDVTNMLGQIVYSGKTATSGGKLEARIQLRDMPGGAYLLSLRSGSANKIFHIVVEPIAYKSVFLQ